MFENRLTTERRDHVLVVRGAVDELSAGSFRHALADLLATAPGPADELVADLDEVEFFPSIALGALVTAVREAERSRRRLVVRAGPGSVVARVLAISGLDPLRGDPTS